MNSLWLNNGNRFLITTTKATLYSRGLQQKSKLSEIETEAVLNTRKCRWMNESRTGIEFRGIGIGIGFLSNTNNICLRLMVAKWGAKRPSKKEKTHRRKQERNMRRCLQCLRNLTAGYRETATQTEGDNDSSHQARDTALLAPQEVVGQKQSQCQ